MLDADFLRDLCGPLGPVAIRRMFGGLGLFLDGRMFALVTGDTLWFKVDGETAARFEDRGLPRFAYETKGGRRTVMSYARAPEEVFDDPDAFADWARGAIAAAARSASRETARKSRRRPPLKA